jgi:glycosyltransferase involved in cell wall biosynthesis
MVSKLLSKPNTIALIVTDIIGERMAGPGIRYWEFARVLGQRFPVKLIVPPFVPMDSAPSTENCPAPILLCRSAQDLRRSVEDCDVIVTLGVVLFLYPFLTELGKPLVLDIYNPMLLEDLPREAESDLARQLTTNENYLDAHRINLRAGDFFVCAGEKQRDFWLGMLSALGRVNPYTYRQDPTLRRLIDVVPFGLPEEPPRHTHPVLKGVHRAIAAEDKLLLWGGGIWNWFDAPTLIRAMPLILQHRADVKLFFMGTKRSRQELVKRTAVEETIALSKELGLYERHIFFNEWVPYDERQNYLLEADVGISLHPDHVETRFSFRTRLLDYLWAGLPVVSTYGDVMSETLAAQNLAYLVDPGDASGVAQTVLALLDNPNLRAEYAERAQKVADHYHWQAVAQPLVDFCAAPYIAPDNTYLRQRPLSVEKQSTSWRLLVRGWRALRLGGLSSLLQQSGEYLRWKMRG